MPKAKRKVPVTYAPDEVEFWEQSNDSVIYSESPNHRAVVGKEEFNKHFDIIPVGIPEQPTQ